MASRTGLKAFPDEPTIPSVFNLPVLYEDEEEGEMGENNVHVITDEILHVCLGAHLTSRPELRVFSNLNCHYREGPPHPKTGSLPYISPDIMVVRPRLPLGMDVRSYTIDADGPAPVLAIEILSERSAQQRDLTDKVELYAKLGIAEYILVDVTGQFLPERLLLKRLQANRTWTDEKDADGGVTSRLDFRIIIDTDGWVRVINTMTGRSYPRPDEAQAEAEAHRRAEERIRELEAELKRLRESSPEAKSKKTSGKRRRKK